MTSVKGTKTARLQVVPYRPWLRSLVIGGAVAAVVVASGISFVLGGYLSQSGERNAEAQLVEAQQALQAKTREAENLSQQVANLSLANEVDKASNEDVRQEVIALKGEIAKLEEDITFYRGLMAPTENQRGLTIGSVDVISTGVSRQYDFKIVVQQLATNHQVLNGDLRVNIVGTDGGIAKIIPLKEVSQQVDSDDIKLRFKYFQNISGQIELPFGFEAERIEVTARSTGKDAAEVEKKFGWLVQES